MSPFDPGSPARSSPELTPRTEQLQALATVASDDLGGAMLRSKDDNGNANADDFGDEDAAMEKMMALAAAANASVPTPSTKASSSPSQPPPPPPSSSSSLSSSSSPPPKLGPSKSFMTPFDSERATHGVNGVNGEVSDSGSGSSSVDHNSPRARAAAATAVFNNGARSDSASSSVSDGSSSSSSGDSSGNGKSRNGKSKHAAFVRRGSKLDELRVAGKKRARALLKNRRELGLFLAGLALPALAYPKRAFWVSFN